MSSDENVWDRIHRQMQKDAEWGNEQERLEKERDLTRRVAQGEAIAKAMDDRPLACARQQPWEFGPEAPAPYAVNRAPARHYKRR